MLNRVATEGVKLPLPFLIINIKYSSEQLNNNKIRNRKSTDVENDDSPKRNKFRNNITKYKYGNNLQNNLLTKSLNANSDSKHFKSYRESSINYTNYAPARPILLNELNLLAATCAYLQVKNKNKELNFKNSFSKSSTLKNADAKVKTRNAAFIKSNSSELQNNLQSLSNNGRFIGSYRAVNFNNLGNGRGKNNRFNKNIFIPTRPINCQKNTETVL